MMSYPTGDFCEKSRKKRAISRKHELLTKFLISKIILSTQPMMRLFPSEYDEDDKLSEAALKYEGK